MNTPIMRSVLRSPMLAFGLVAIFSGTALATPPTTFIGTITSRATLSESIHFNAGSVKLQTKEPVDFVTATVAIAAGGSSGWHSHPGIVLVSVVTGSLTFYNAACVGTVYPPGTSFVESGSEPGLVRNNGAEAASVLATYIVPAGTPNSALRVDAANPGCPQS